MATYRPSLERCHSVCLLRCDTSFTFFKSQRKKVKIFVLHPRGNEANKAPLIVTGDHNESGCEAKGFRRRYLFPAERVEEACSRRAPHVEVKDFV